MNTANFYTPEATAAATFSRLRVVIASLRETTLTPDRRAWFEKTRDEFRYLLTLAAAYTFNAYQMTVINDGADDFNEGQLFYMGATIAAPSLHYSE